MNTETKTWTGAAEASVQEYLQQVKSLLAGQEADPSEVVEDLRRHVMLMAETGAGKLVTVLDARRMLSTLGSPSEVVSSLSGAAMDPGLGQIQSASVPPMPRLAQERSASWIWLAVAAVAIVIVIASLPVVWMSLRYEEPEPAPTGKPGMYTEEFLKSHDAEYFFERVGSADAGYHGFAGLWALCIKVDWASGSERDAIVERAMTLAEDGRLPFGKRYQLCYVVSSVEDLRMIPRFEKILKNDPNPRLRGVVAGALGHFESAQADEALRRALPSEQDPEVRQWIERALTGEFPRPATPQPGSGPEV